MRLRESLFVLVAFASTAIVANAACSSKSCLDDGAGACGSATTDGGDASLVDGTVGDGPGVDATPPGCDLSADVRSSPACVDEGVAVFVDGVGGSDANAGTRASPAKTLGGGLAKLGGRSRVYVCAGTYEEHVTLSGGVSLYGGFVCGTWSATGEVVKLSPADKGVALTVRDGSSAVVVSDLSITSKDGVERGESSVGVLVANVAKVTLRRVVVTAGKGSDGVDGTDAVDFAPATAPDGTAGRAEEGRRRTRRA